MQKRFVYLEKFSDLILSCNKVAFTTGDLTRKTKTTKLLGNEDNDLISYWCPWEKVSYWVQVSSDFLISDGTCTNGFLVSLLARVYQIWRNVIILIWQLFLILITLIVLRRFETKKSSVLISSKGKCPDPPLVFNCQFKTARSQWFQQPMKKVHSDDRSRESKSFRYIASWIWASHLPKHAFTKYCKHL